MGLALLLFLLIILLSIIMKSILFFSLSLNTHLTDFTVVELFAPDQN